jgi:hypothetical protein
MLARFYTSPPRRISGISRKHPLLLPELILLLLACIVNGVELGTHTVMAGALCTSAPVRQCWSGEAFMSYGFR